MSRRCIHSISATRTSSTEISVPRRAETAWRRNWETDTPGISSGYWKARNIPARARASGAQLDLGALKDDPASGDVIAGVPGEGVGEGRLARAVGAHERVQLAPPHDEIHTAEDLVALDSDVQVLDAQHFGAVALCHDALCLGGRCQFGHMLHVRPASRLPLRP